MLNDLRSVGFMRQWASVFNMTMQERELHAKQIRLARILVQPYKKLKQGEAWSITLSPFTIGRFQDATRMRQDGIFIAECLMQTASMLVTSKEKGQICKKFVTCLVHSTQSYTSQHQDNFSRSGKTASYCDKQCQSSQVELTLQANVHEIEIRVCCCILSLDGGNAWNLHGKQDNEGLLQCRCLVQWYLW